MTYHITHPHEQARLEAILAELTPRPVEAQCETARSDDWLALIAACNEKEKTNDAA